VNKSVSCFAMGSAIGVKEYLLEQIPQLAVRIGANEDSLQKILFAAFEACKDRLSIDREAPFVPVIPEARALYEFIGNHAILQGSELIGTEHFSTALEFQRRGGNVLVVQNHTSGADTLVTDILLDRQFPGITQQFTWMVGHVVTLYLLPLLLAAAVSRYQIFSVKYRSLAASGEARRMCDQNGRALCHLKTATAPGGKFIGLYPEGGRGEGKLLPGVPQTMKIADIMSQCPEGLMILPSHVVGAPSILPVVREEDEFCRFFERLQRGRVQVRFGQAIPWSDSRFHPDTSGITDCKERRMYEKQCQVDVVMQMIKDLAP
jgi:1-acyl-sn-glycerol-3-phosphate acyltransferase